MRIALPFQELACETTSWYLTGSRTLFSEYRHEWAKQT